MIYLIFIYFFIIILILFILFFIIFYLFYMLTIQIARTELYDLCNSIIMAFYCSKLSMKNLKYFSLKHQ